jgi:hypothetical protein
MIHLTGVAVLASLSEDEGPTLPGLTDGKPGDAVFKALAVLPITGLPPGVVRESPSFDVGELIRLIKKESEA